MVASTRLRCGFACGDIYFYFYFSALHLRNVTDARARPHWTVLATDVWGLPWLARRPISHGTWLAYVERGTVQKLKAGRVECPVCPPEPDSRSNRGRQEDPHLLDLVRYRRLHSAMGDEHRVRAHLRVGAGVFRVVRARHEDVTQPSSAYASAIAPRLDHSAQGCPQPFGTGTEVVPASTRIDLTEWPRRRRDASVRPGQLSMTTPGANQHRW
jgi:hypothetical protein